MSAPPRGDFRPTRTTYTAWRLSVPRCRRQAAPAKEPHTEDWVARSPPDEITVFRA